MVEHRQIYIGLPGGWPEWTSPVPGSSLCGGEPKNVAHLELEA